MDNPSISTAPRGETAESSAVEASADFDLRVPCYCEENSWRVAYRHLNNAAPDDDTAAPPSSSSPSSRKRNPHYHVVFVSNERRCCPYFQQRATPPDKCVCWDYHVFVVRSVAWVKKGNRLKYFEVKKLEQIDGIWVPFRRDS